MPAIRIDLSKARPLKTVAAPHPRLSSPPKDKKPQANGKKPVYTKVFRWQPPANSSHRPANVEIAGSFTAWQKIPLEHVGVTDTWQLTLSNIPSNRTHHYMLLVDGHPVSDQNCDGLALPEGPLEAQFQLPTPRGPRVLMLFAQTK
jgi:hypothetical protein